MAVVTFTPSQSSNLRTHLSANLHTLPSLSYKSLHPKKISTRGGARRSHGNGVLVLVRAYMEKPNSASNFASKVIGSLPVIGLFARIFSDEGGVGGDIIDFAEFRRRVGKKCSVTDSRAFIEFQDRRGRGILYMYFYAVGWLLLALVLSSQRIFSKG